MKNRLIRSVKGYGKGGKKRIYPSAPPRRVDLKPKQEVARKEDRRKWTGRGKRANAWKIPDSMPKMSMEHGRVQGEERGKSRDRQA